MKRRILTALGIVVISGVFLLPIAIWNFHILMIGQSVGFLWDLTACWKGILGSDTVLRLYFLLLAAVVLFAFWAVASSSYVKYRSGMYLLQPGITKDRRIEIPLPAGQGQFGTAWWMSRKNMKHRYETVRVTHNAKLRKLFQDGEKDYMEVKNAEVTLD